jgi:RNA polymerase sigma-70 factor (ECF subfamily)
MRQIKYGEKSALDSLIRRYHGPIYAYIVRMGLEYHAASDIVQEVFIKLIRNAESYEPDRPFKPWLYTIASNTFKDYFKKAYVQRDVLACDIPESTTSADNPEDIFMLQQDRESVETALNSLSEIHRQIVVLRYYQDLKLDEISLVLSIPLGTVKSRLSNALHNLKKLLVKGEMLHDNKAG